MEGTFRQRGDSWEYRVMAVLPDGTRVRKTFCRRTKRLAKAAYDDWMEHKSEQIVKRQTVAEWGAYAAPREQQNRG